MESFEYESAWAFGANCGNNDADSSVAKLIDLCNDYGMDTIEMRQCAVSLHGSHPNGLHQWRWRAEVGRHAAYG